MANLNRISKDADELDVLSSIWILSLLDNNPLITYEGIRYRLGLNDDFDIHGLVARHGEMFRIRGGSAELDAWKAEMKEGRKRASWIVRKYHTEDERRKVIDDLKTSDVFRNQFRVSDSKIVFDSTSPTALEVLKWGIERIDRLRKRKEQSQLQKFQKRIQFWVPLLSTLTTLCVVLFNTVQQLQSNRMEALMKEYEVSFRPKEEAYSDYLRHLSDAKRYAAKSDLDKMDEEFSAAEAAFYEIEALTIKTTDSLSHATSSYRMLCARVADRFADQNRRAYADSAASAELKSIRSLVRTALFSSSQQGPIAPH